MFQLVTLDRENVFRNIVKTPDDLIVFEYIKRQLNAGHADRVIRLLKDVCGLEIDLEKSRSEKLLGPIEESASEHEVVFENRCMVCNEDLGENNPRQLCGKTYCINDDSWMYQ